jgi:hypothetical protein
MYAVILSASLLARRIPVLAFDFLLNHHRSPGAPFMCSFTAHEWGVHIPREKSLTFASHTTYFIANHYRYPPLSSRAKSRDLDFDSAFDLIFAFAFVFVFALRAKGPFHTSPTGWVQDQKVI